jgi:heavy metal sensor kinase
MMRGPASIRARLTLWHVAIMALVLAVFAIATYAYVRESLFAQIDARLDESLVLIAKAARADLNDMGELERHSNVLAFRVREGDWPHHLSPGWWAGELDGAGVPPASGRWIYTSPNGGIYHLKEIPAVVGDLNLHLAAAEQSAQIHVGLERLRWTLLVAYPVTLLLILGGGYFLSGRLLRPLQDITRRARLISAENLAERLTVTNPKDELGQLSIVLNDAFARLAESFERQRRFTQDAAHEIRTPLAVLRSVGEVGLSESRDVAVYRDIIGSMLEEADRLTQLVDALLMLARAEAGQYAVARRDEDVFALVQEVVECLRVLAEEKQQTLTLSTTPAAPASVNAELAWRAHIDRDTVRLALMNLLANALRFTPAGGVIEVRVVRRDASVVVEIQDNGPGIAAEHHARLFERFYRVDPSRSQASGGTGLGLAIARWAAEANDGRIELSSDPGVGSVFRLVLPRKP